MENTIVNMHEINEKNIKAKEINYYVYQDLVRIEDTDYKNRGIKFYNISDGSFYFEIKDVNNVVAIIQDGLDFFVQYKNGTIIPHLSKDWYSASKIMPYSREIDLLKEAFFNGKTKPSIKDNQHIHAITKYKISSRYLIEKRRMGYMLFNITDQLVSLLDDYKRMANFISIKRKKLVLFEKHEDVPTKYGLYDVIDNCEYVLDEETYKSLRCRKPDVFKISLIKQELEQFFNTGVTQDFHVIKGINILATKEFVPSKDLRKVRIRKPLIHDTISPEELGMKRKEEKERIKEAGIQSQTKNALYQLNNPPREIPDFEPEYIDNYLEILNGGKKPIIKPLSIVKEEKEHEAKPVRLMKRKALEELNTYVAPQRDMVVMEKNNCKFLYDASMYYVENEDIDPEEYNYVQSDEFDFDLDDPLYRQSLAYKDRDLLKEPSFIKTKVFLFSNHETPIFEIYHCEGLIQYGPAHFYAISRGTKYRINDNISEYIHYLDCPIPELSDAFKGCELGSITPEERRNYYLKNALHNRRYNLTMPGCLYDMNLNFPGGHYPLKDIADIIINDQYMIINNGIYDMVNYRYYDYSKKYGRITLLKDKNNNGHPVLWGLSIPDHDTVIFDGITGEELFLKKRIKARRNAPKVLKMTFKNKPKK
ncbi:MAG: hypothetical protein J5892_04065 [Bacilli bacterium]|nr:hypothetical protein [Bacilli bacterium]